MKIAIVVHGRFHAVDLARELGRRGHEVVLFTNYPPRTLRRFGLAPRQVRSLVLHGILSRLAWAASQRGLGPYPEARLHTWFGRWARRQLLKERWDVVHCFSGVSEEVLRALAGSPARTLLGRGSSHIRVQSALLEEEVRRTGTSLDRPTPWMVGREEREYGLADLVVVLSRFAYRSFVSSGVPEAKLRLLPLGAELGAFRADAATIEARCRRLLAGEPLRVLYVGTVSFRKGFWDLARVIRSLAGEGIRFRVVGPVAAECRPLVAALRPLAEFVPAQPQARLRDWYAWGDVFAFPTIEDGYAMVLAQADAGGLPILTTPNCTGPDLVREGETGWILPIRSPEAFGERLRWCTAHRPEVAGMVRRAHAGFRPRDWTDVAADFERICLEAVGR